LVVIYCKPMF